MHRVQRRLPLLPSVTITRRSMIQHALRAGLRGPALYATHAEGIVMRYHKTCRSTITLARERGIRPMPTSALAIMHAQGEPPDGATPDRGRRLYYRTGPPPCGHADGAHRRGVRLLGR